MKIEEQAVPVVDVFLVLVLPVVVLSVVFLVRSTVVFLFGVSGVLLEPVVFVLSIVVVFLEPVLSLLMVVCEVVFVPAAIQFIKSQCAITYCRQR